MLDTEKEGLVTESTCREGGTSLRPADEKGHQIGGACTTSSPLGSQVKKESMKKKAINSKGLQTGLRGEDSNKKN